MVDGELPRRQATQSIRHGVGQPHAAFRGLCGYLVFLAAVVACGLSLFSVSGVTPISSDNVLLRFASRVVLLTLLDAALFLPLGFLVAAAAAARLKQAGCAANLAAILAVLAGALCLALVARTALGGLPLRRPGLAETVWLMSMVTAGCWAGFTWCRSASAGRWLLAQTLLAIGILVTLGGVVLVWGLQPAPADFAETDVSTDDRQRLVQKLQRHDPRRLEPDALQTLTLSEQELNQLLSWALSLVACESKGRVEVTDNDLELRFSCLLPRIDRYLNLTASGAAFVDEGQLAVKPLRLQVGSLSLPSWALRAAGPSIFDRAVQNRHTRPFFSSLESIELAHGSAAVTYGRLQLSGRLLHDTLEAFGQSIDLAPAVEHYAKQLIEQSQQPEQLDLAEALQMTFAAAKRRVEAGADPVDENRAALLAIGYLFGDGRVGLLVGPDLPRPPERVAWKFRGVRFYGRKDWARHFALSAGIELGSSPLTNHMIGVLKEELDADGGSGFSFADLLADRAGAKLAREATSNPARARLLQRRLAGDWELSAIYPEATGLPEGLSEEEFEQKFGGVGGAGYQRVLAEIERRVDSCALYSAAQ